MKASVPLIKAGPTLSECLKPESGRPCRNARRFQVPERQGEIGRSFTNGMPPKCGPNSQPQIVALAPLLVLWFGTGWWSKVAAAVLISFFPVLVNTVRGLDVFRTTRAAPAQIFRKLRVPHCLPVPIAARPVFPRLSTCRSKINRPSAISRWRSAGCERQRG